MELEKAEIGQVKYERSKTRPCTEEFAKFVSSLRIFSLNLSLFEFKILTSNAFRTFVSVSICTFSFYGKCGKKFNF